MAATSWKNGSWTKSNLANAQALLAISCAVAWDAWNLEQAAPAKACSTDTSWCAMFAMDQMLLDTSCDENSVMVARITGQNSTRNMEVKAARVASVQQVLEMFYDVNSCFSLIALQLIKSIKGWWYMAQLAKDHARFAKLLGSSSWLLRQASPAMASIKGTRSTWTGGW